MYRCFSEKASARTATVFFTEFGYKKRSFFRFKKRIKPRKPNVGFRGVFILCTLLNKPRIKILIVISEVHQFHLRFSHGILFLRSLEICL